jgi:hypothetical protein
MTTKEEIIIALSITFSAIACVLNLLVILRRIGKI